MLIFGVVVQSKQFGDRCTITTNMSHPKKDWKPITVGLEDFTS